MKKEKQKLELKDITPYLPYELRLFCDRNSKIYNIFGYVKDSLLTSTLLKPSVDEMFYTAIFAMKPILRPLSDLTKEIEHNGEKFVPIVRLSGYDRLKGELSFGYSQKIYYSKLMLEKTNEFVVHTIPSDLFSMDYFTVQKLFEWNIDVFGLIEKGLAVDMNTINF